MQSFRLRKSWFYQTMDIVWNEIIAGREATAEQISDMRLACTHAARVCAKVTRKCKCLRV